MKNLILTGLTLSILASTAFADGGANARANWEHSRNPAMQAASADVPAQNWPSQAQAPAVSREAREAFEDRVLRENHANYHGR
jgi:hypothetical protein